MGGFRGDSWWGKAARIPLLGHLVWGTPKDPAILQSPGHLLKIQIPGPILNLLS